MTDNVRVYEPLRDSERFLVELPQGNQMSEHSQTRYQQWLIHDVVASKLFKIIFQFVKTKS